MKKMRVMAFVLSSIVAGVPFANAQLPASAGAGTVRPERGMERGGRRGALRQGLDLSASEKAALKSVHEKYRAETGPMRESLRTAMQEARADREKGDTAAARAVIARTKTTRTSLRSVMGREQNEIRAALSPANRMQFDANVKQAVAARGRHGKGRGGRKGGRRPRASNS